MEKMISYKIPRKAYNALLKERKGEEKKMNPQEYVMQVINNDYGLFGKVTHLIVSD